MQRPSARTSYIVFVQHAVWTIGAILLLALLLQFIHFPTEHVFFVLFTAFVLSAAIAPAVGFLEAKHIPRPVGVLATYVVVLALLAGVVGLVIPLTVAEVRTLGSRLPGYVGMLQSALSHLNPALAREFSMDNMTAQLSHGLTTFSDRITAAVSSAVTLGISTVLVLVITFFLTVEKNLLPRALSAFVPKPNRRQACELLETIQDQIGHWARAQLLLAVFFGTAFGAGLKLAGVQYAFTIGLVGAVLEVIPYVGGFITVVLALLVALTQSPMLALFVAAWYFIVVELEGHIIAPKLFDKFLGIHPLAVVIALFVGGEAMGVLGALLSIPIAIIIKVLMEEHRDAKPVTRTGKVKRSAALTHKRLR